MHIAINRPQKKNAFNAQMYHDMREAITAADRDEKIRAILIHCTSDTFSAGADLNSFDDRDPNTPSAADLFLKTIHGCTKPIVAAVSGIAVGIGATLLLHCDLVYASQTRFRMPFVNLGVCPEAGSSLLLPAMAGHTKAAEILLLGDFFDTETAIEIGLVNSKITKDNVLSVAIEKAEQLAEKPAQALQLTKKLMKKVDHDVVTKRMEEEFLYFDQMLQSPASIEARQALKNRARKTL